MHTAGISEHRYLPESSGAGCAFLDYDNDGWMDVYLVNGGKSVFYDPKTPLRNALYRNNRDGTFTDVTEKAGVGAGGYPAPSGLIATTMAGSTFLFAVSWTRRKPTTGPAERGRMASLTTVFRESSLP